MCADLLAVSAQDLDHRGTADWAFRLRQVPLHYNERQPVIWRFTSLLAGTRLGPYEIVSPSGPAAWARCIARATRKLNRDVALKVLPDAFARDPDRLARFQREAQVLASLNHPHIAAIYGFEDSGETHALVLELVEGDDAG